MGTIKERIVYMSSIEFTLWYYGDALYKNRSFYELIEKQKDLELTYFYGPQDKVEITDDRIIDKKKVNEMFCEAEAFYPGISIVMGGKNLEIMMCDSCLCEAQYYGTVHFNVLSFEAKSPILKKKILATHMLEDIFFQAIEIYKPIYGIFDDSDIIYDLMESEEMYKPNEYIQNLFWGNYYGKEYCNCKGIKSLITSDLSISTKLQSGYFVKLSETCDDCCSLEVSKKRKKLIKYIISPISKHHINKFKMIDKY